MIVADWCIVLLQILKYLSYIFIQNFTGLRAIQNILEPKSQDLNVSLCFSTKMISIVIPDTISSNPWPTSEGVHHISWGIRIASVILNKTLDLLQNNLNLPAYNDHDLNYVLILIENFGSIFKRLKHQIIVKLL